MRIVQTIAMQKVVGSSPISRLREARFWSGFFAFWAAQGRTLYLFVKDSGTKSSCFGACAKNWPPLRASGELTAGSGATSSLLGTTKRSDGAAQVTYNGHSLYVFAGDKKSGAANGQRITAFGGSWYALSPSGDQVSGIASGPNAGGSSAYGY